MKKILVLLAFLLIPASALAQSTPPLCVSEIDGSPSKCGITRIKVSNGSLTISGNTATITTGGGGGGLTVGTTAIASGTAGRFLYETSGNVLGEVSTLTSDGTILTFSPTVTTGTGATSGLNANANSLTTGDAFNFASSSVTSGNVFKISATGTAAASNTKTALNVATSGANGTSTQTTYGAQISNTSTGTSSTNIGLLTGASGGTTNIGLEIRSGTTAQGMHLYNTYTDASNYERAVIDWNAGSFRIITEKAGTGTNRNLNILPAGSLLGLGASATIAWYVSSLHLLAASNSSQIIFGAGSDLTLRRNDVANLALGAAAAASPVAQKLSVQGATGTNTAGATWTLEGSLGTSQGAPGRIHLTGGAMIAASGTTTQTAVDRIISGATKVLTNNSATAIVNATAAAGTNAAGVIDYAVEISDGTDVQYETGSVAYGVSNKGGVFSGNTATKFGNHQNATAGTLTVTFAVSGANPAVLSVNANSSLTPSTGYPRITYTLRNLTQQAVAPQ